MAKKSKGPVRTIPKLARFLNLPPMAMDWKGVDELMPMLEKLRAEGAVVMFKLDGEHQPGSNQGPYTALATGEVLAGKYFRADRPTPEEALAAVIIAYAKERWGFDPGVKK